jgi:hypothetical protein
LERWKIQRFMALDCCHLLAKVHCMTPEVTKIPYDISAATQNLILLNSVVCYAYICVFEFGFRRICE